MADLVEFGVMGPIRAAAGGGELRIGGPRERAVLARLVLDANRVVSVDRLIDAVWPVDPPASARGQIAICVSRLRRTLGDAGRVIVTATPGYTARLDEQGADWLRFNGLVGRARACVVEDDRSTAVALLREALGLWRGAPFEDLPGLRADAAWLQSVRLDAVETCADLELQLGHHHQVSKDLAVVVAEHPLRERARAQLMLAQYHAGLRADALRTYQDARRVLIEQIGIEPGPELRALHEQILRGEPMPAPRAADPVPAVPSQLPRQPLPFAGRAAELSELDWALGGHADAHSAVVLSGPGDVGKTALALRWAHCHAEEFPDGQLHAELTDDLGRPVPAGAVLDHFLRALGHPAGAVPDDLAARAALYRSTVARARLLVFLDGAVDFAQVRPLLPGGANARVIVTSREPMDELVAREGAHAVSLSPLSHEESLRLLGKLLGPDWVARESREAGNMVALAHGFPLRLRRAAVRARSEQHRRRPLDESAGVSA